MEFFRTASNPWGQEVLLGIAWDLVWVALILGAAFVVGHAIYARIMKPAASPPAHPAAPGTPDRILRHTTGARAFHWLMSLAMLALLITAFVPVIGLQFPWVTIHWIAGIGLLLTVIYHIVHSLVALDWRTMVVGKADLDEGRDQLKGLFRKGEAAPPRAGKYPIDHKAYHHIVSLTSVVAIVTGLLMMVRVDTPFWERNPYLLSDGLWGVMYVLHGLSGVALITLVIAHIYFAVRPEKLWMTKAMINGWISREQFLSHHDPARWDVSGPGSVPAPSGGALPEGAVRSRRADD